MIRCACTLEATARKPGNVHPGAEFGDLSYADLLSAAYSAAPELARAPEVGVGEAVRRAVLRSREAAGTNANLGIVLLIAPLAAVPENIPLSQGIDAVLDGLTQRDAALVFQAIRTAAPGGLGSAEEEDVSGEPTRPLREIMALAAERDAIAAEYAEGFPLVLGFGVPFLSDCRDFAADWEEALIGLHLRLMERRPDTLIARKCGPDVALESAERARRVVQAGWPETQAGRDELESLDRWLREDGNRRNPGTTADLVAASLFAALREGVVGMPGAG